MSARAQARVGAVTPPAPPEVVAAIVAAVAELNRQSFVVEAPVPSAGSEWVRAARLAARRAGLQRGSWRLAPRVGPRRGS